MVGFDFKGFIIRTPLNVKSQRTEKIEPPFSQGTDDSQIFRCQTLATIDHEYVKISSFAVLNMKFWIAITSQPTQKT